MRAENTAIPAEVAVTPRPRSTGHLLMVTIAIACGIAGALGAVLFRLMIRVAEALFFEGTGGLHGLLAQGASFQGRDLLAAARQVAWYWRLLLPALGGLLVGPLIYVFAREARGHGVPEVIGAIAARGGVIRRRVVVVKAVASAICIGSGGSVGREGPIVQIGSALGSAMGQALRFSAAQMRTVVGCGSAAGIAATFNAPIAGAMFAAEIVVGNFAVPQLSPIVISSVVATVVSRLFLGNHPAFPVPAYQLVSPFELLPYMLTGLVAGFVGLAFTNGLYATEDLFNRSPFPEWLRASVGGLLVGVIGIWLPQVFGVGYSTIDTMLTRELPVVMLGLLVVAKLAATVITIGSGGSGGIFAPSLFMGAATGSFLGSFVHHWFPGWTASSGAYALVTTGAVVAAATHAPITSIIIIFELTQSISIIPPLMAACVVSTLVAVYLQRESIYTEKLRRQGIDLYREEPINVLKTLYVHDIIDREPEVVPSSASLREIVSRVLASEHTEFFVVDAAGRLEGTIYLREFTRMLAEQEVLMPLVVARDLAEGSPTVTEDTDLSVVIGLFSGRPHEELPVVREGEPWHLVGSVHKRDVIHAYNQEVLRRDLAGAVSDNVLVAAKGQQVALGEGYVLQEIQPPPRFYGRSIRDLGLGAQAGVHVVLLRRSRPRDGRPSVRVPLADDVIQAGDRLVVSGTRSAVESIDRL